MRHRMSIAIAMATLLWLSPAALAHMTVEVGPLHSFPSRQQPSPLGPADTWGVDAKITYLQPATPPPNAPPDIHLPQSFDVLLRAVSGGQEVCNVTTRVLNFNSGDVAVPLRFQISYRTTQESGRLPGQVPQLSGAPYTVQVTAHGIEKSGTFRFRPGGTPQCVKLR